MAARGEYANELVGRGGHGGHGGHGHGHRGHRGRHRHRSRGRRFFGGGWGPWAYGPWDWYGGSVYDYDDDFDEGYGPLLADPPAYHVELRRVHYLMGAEPPAISMFVGCDACGNPCFVSV